MWLYFDWWTSVMNIGCRIPHNINSKWQFYYLLVILDYILRLLCNYNNIHIKVGTNRERLQSQCNCIGTTREHYHFLSLFLFIFYTTKKDKIHDLINSINFRFLNTTPTITLASNIYKRRNRHFSVNSYMSIRTLFSCSEALSCKIVVKYQLWQTHFFSSESTLKWGNCFLCMINQ